LAAYNFKNPTSGSHLWASLSTTCYTLLTGKNSTENPVGYFFNILKIFRLVASFTLYRNLKAFCTGKRTLEVPLNAPGTRFLKYCVCSLMDLIVLQMLFLNCRILYVNISLNMV